MAVAADPRETRIHDEADARHGQRGFGHIGGEYDAPGCTGVEHPSLFRRRQAGEQGQNLGL